MQLFPSLTQLKRLINNAISSGVVVKVDGDEVSSAHVYIDENDITVIKLMIDDANSEFTEVLGSKIASITADSIHLADDNVSQYTEGYVTFEEDSIITFHKRVDTVVDLNTVCNTIEGAAC